MFRSKTPALFVILFGLLAPQARAAEVSFREAGGELLLELPRWAVAIDATSGSIRRIDDRTAAGTLLRGGKNLWVIERHKQPAIESSACRMTHVWNAEQRQLALQFDGPDAAVTLLSTAEEEGPAWLAKVAMKQGTMIGWQFPASLEFDVAPMEEFILPDQLGLAFSQAFFKPGGGAPQRQMLGPKGLERVAGMRCQMRPVTDEPVPVTAGRDAAGWLPEWYVKEMSQWKVTANRTPASKPSLSLVETQHGTWLAGDQLGGWGWLFRFGGILGDRDARPQIASVIATLSRLYQRPPSSGGEVAVPTALSGKAPAQWPERPKRIGIISSRPIQPGVRRPQSTERLVQELRRVRWVTDAGIEVVAIQDADALRAALAEPRKWFALINTIGEGVPARSAEEVAATLDAIRGYVRDGGIWWEAGGGYSFYHGIVPGGDANVQTNNRHFCDFAALVSKQGRWTLFGVQSPEAIYVPPSAEIAASGPAESRVSRYAHTFLALAKSGQSVELPLQQMVLGTPHRQVLQEYALRNGFSRGLEAKASAELVEKLKKSILLKVSGRDLKQTARVAENLPAPVLFHIADYLRGGFDKQYPDHLPPNPKMGTSEDLSALLEACRKSGHLFMPYTNPTWWCVNPKGPTFEREGDAPLSRNLEGKDYPESYGIATTQGYSICAWHPAVRAANDATREQFTRQFPVDVLFQDQVGARGTKWDTNPAAPHAGAYLEGIHRIARVDSAHVPLGTEDGHDRLINCETIFSGLSWPWLPNRTNSTHTLYEEVWPEGTWRIEPLALFLAHDKALFYHHDLGGFVRDRLDLSLTLAMGYGLSWWTHTDQPRPAERDWIERLCRVQAAIGPRCAGRRLDDFQYLRRNGADARHQAIRSRWGDLEIVANLTDAPWTIDDRTAIAPEGFLARSPDLEAGIFSRYGGKDEALPRWLIRERTANGWTEWSPAEETKSQDNAAPSLLRALRSNEP